MDGEAGSLAVFQRLTVPAQLVAKLVGGGEHVLRGIRPRRNPREAAGLAI